jgi:hypothetical protein
MKINKQEFVQLMKEAYNNRLVTEDGEEQGATMENPPADVVATIKAVNARLQGKAEYREAAQALLEYIIEYKQEGGTATDLLYVCQQVLGDDAKLVYPILKRLGERRANAQAGSSEEAQPQAGPANRPEDIQEEMSEQEWKDELARLKDDKMHFTSLMNNAGNAANKTSDADRKNKLGEEYEFYKAKADQIEAQIEAHNASGAGRQMRAV